ncbi:MAG: porin [Ignavibacteria bacterium]
MKRLIIGYLIFFLPAFAQEKETTTVFGFLQPLYQINLTDNVVPNNEFKLNRIRLGIERKFSDWFKGEIEIDPLDKNLIKDAVISFDVFNEIEISVGRQKKPFSYERLISVKNIPFLERSKIVKELDQLGYCGRDIGIKFTFTKKMMDLNFNLIMGLFNGNSGLPDGDNNNSKSFTERIEISKGKFFKAGFNSSQRVDSISAKYFVANGFDFSIRLMKEIKITSEILFGKKNSQSSIGGFYSLVEYEFGDFSFGIRFSQYYKDIKRSATNFYEAKIDFQLLKTLKFQFNFIGEEKNSNFESSLVLGVSYEF